MRRHTGGIIYLAAGIVAGIASAYVSIESAGVEASSNGGPWFSRAEGLAGAAGIYVRSHYLIEGRLPPAGGQLIEAVAETDADGQALNSNCSYRIISTGPLPRWWSLGTVEGSGSNSSQHGTADTDTVIREADGSVAITAASEPWPGNWLKSPDTRNFSLLYSATAAGGPVQSAPPFSVKREGCP